MNGNSPKLKRTLFDLCTITVKVLSTNSFQNIAEKATLVRCKKYMSSVALSATSGKVEMHTLRTSVDESL